MAELLLELVSEDIPPAMQEPAAENLARLFAERLKVENCDAHLTAKFSTPKRIGFCFDGLPKKIPEKKEIRRGPKLTAPQQAIDRFKDGFKKSLNVLNANITEQDGYYFAEISHPAVNMADFLAEAIPALLKNFTWPKSMRWPQGGDFRWVRPLRSILCILDGKRVKFSIAGLKSGNQSESETIISFENYKKIMEEKHILIDPEARQQKIKNEIEEEKKKMENSISRTLQKEESKKEEKDFQLPNYVHDLIQEMARISEYPVLKKGEVPSSEDLRQIMLPSKIRDSVFRKEYCIHLFRGNRGEFWMSDYLMIIDGEKNNYDEIIRGFNSVLYARQKDALFFLEQDSETGLDKLRNKLKELSFHPKLGTMLDQANRFEKLCLGKTLRAALPGLQWEDVIQQAAHYAKIDMTSLSGREFPDALGQIGCRLYAQANPKLDADTGRKIIKSIESHLQPDPGNIEESILYIADKADMLAGFFSIGEMPTGSKDPFALRRAALGIIRIILDNEIFQTLDLNDLFAEALELYPSASKNKSNDEILTGLRRFMADRLKYHLRAQKQQADLVDAAMQAETGLNLARIHARLNALAAFLNTHNGAHLMTAWRRISGILKNTAAPPDRLIAGRLTEPAEKALARALDMKDYEKALAAHDFTHAFRLLAGLRAPVDAFFETVRVNVDDPEIRQNRRALCAALRAIMNRAADFSSISGRP